MNLVRIFLLLLMLTGAAQATTTLEWWQFWTDPEIKPTIDSLVKEFEAANPDITVKITDLTWANGQEKLVISFSAGTGPDVFEMGSDWMAQFAANDQLLDISSAIAHDSAQFEGWGMATYQGKVYAWPWILGTRVLFGNRDLMAKAGFGQEWVPTTAMDLLGAAYRIRLLDRKALFGWGSNTAEKHRLYKKYLPFFWSSGSDIFTDDGKYCVVSSYYAIDALNYYKALHDSTGYVATQRGIEDAFLDGKVGFIISGDWLLKRIANEKRKFNLMSSLIPGSKGPGLSFMGGEFLAVNAKSQYKEEALKFIAFMTKPANQVRFCRANYSANPSSLEAQKDPFFAGDPHLVTFIKQIKSAKYPPVTPQWPAIEDILEKAVEEVVFNDGLASEALHQAQIEIAKLKKP